MLNFKSSIQNKLRIQNNKTQNYLNHQKIPLKHLKLKLTKPNPLNCGNVFFLNSGQKDYSQQIQKHLHFEILKFEKQVDCINKSQYQLMKTLIKLIDDKLSSIHPGSKVPYY